MNDSNPNAPTIRVGTRRSPLALWQAQHVADALERRWKGTIKCELVEVVTEGDKILDRPLNEVGGKGLFVNAIEDKLLSGEVDIAVHSMKDLPSKLPQGLVIACTPKREDPRDAICGPEGIRIARLPAGLKIGTSSLRRSALIRRLNPEVEIVPIRGNVQTRLRKFEDAEVDAVVLAAAGLHRLGLEDRITEYLDVERFCPAACQGILGVECREDDARTRSLLAPLNDRWASIATAAERAFLETLDGGCQVPMGCYAEVRSETIMTVAGVIVDPRGRPCFIATRAGEPERAAKLGRDLAESLADLGGAKVLKSLSA